MENFKNFFSNLSGCERNNIREGSSYILELRTFRLDENIHFWMIMFILQKELHHAIIENEKLANNHVHFIIVAQQAILHYFG